MRLGPDIFLRACAITAVVFNHARWDIPFDGGMTFLMMLSGFNFAKFGMNGATVEQGRDSLISLGRKILIPSFFAIVAAFVVTRQFDVTELLFISNWYKRDSIALFPIWYPQVIAQMFLGLWLLFLVPVIGQWIFRQPFVASLGLFSAAVLIRYIDPILWESAKINQGLPHLYLWNFILGMVVFFSLDRLGSTWRAKVLATGCALIGASVGWSLDSLDFFWIVLGTVLFVAPLNVTLPSPVAKVIVMIAHNTLAIFLLHIFMFKAYAHIPVPHDQNFKFVIGLFGSIFIWNIVKAPFSAYRNLRNSNVASASVN